MSWKKKKDEKKKKEGYYETMKKYKGSKRNEVEYKGLSVG